MRIVSWNAYGADQATLGELADQIPEENIDLCVLQETHAADDSWYDPLREIHGYGLRPALPENESRALPTGTIYPPETVRGYAIVWNAATVGLAAAPFLVDYTNDEFWGPLTPCDPFQASQKGYNQRPPLAIPVVYGGSKAMVFTWHAPLDPWNGVGLDMFERSGALAEAEGAGLTIIAGDLNTRSVTGYFRNFTGLQQSNSKIDYVLANTALGNVTEIPGLNVYFGSHWAVAAEVN